MPVYVQKTQFSAENAFMLTVCWLYVDCMLTDVDCMLTVLSTGILQHPFLGRGGRLHTWHLPVTYGSDTFKGLRSAGLRVTHVNTTLHGTSVYMCVESWLQTTSWTCDELSHIQCLFADPHFGKLELSFFVSWKQNPTSPTPSRLPWSKCTLTCWPSPLPPNSRLKELTGSNARPEQDSTPGRNKWESLVVIIRSSPQRINETNMFWNLKAGTPHPKFQCSNI